MNKFKISAFVITKNEEKNIARALESLKWADEIIVVDDEASEDQTKEIARKYTEKVYSREWKGFSDQRNFALSQTQYPWVFFLDADEVCSPSLMEWFRKFQKGGETEVFQHTFKSSSQHPATYPKGQRVDMFEIRRLEHFRGRLYKYGESNPSYQWRFFRRESAKFIGEVHEYVIFEGLIRRVENPILHYTEETLSQMMEKVNRYTDLDAERLYREGVRHGPQYMFFSGLAMFLKAYFRKQGFRDGVLGFILAVLSGTVFFLKQAKLYLKYQEQGRTSPPP